MYNYNLDLMFYTTFTLFKHIVAATVRSPDGASRYTTSLMITRTVAQVVLGIAITLFAAQLILNQQPYAFFFLLLPYVLPPPPAAAKRCWAPQVACLFWSVWGVVGCGDL